MSTDFSKITYYDLKWEARAGRLPVLIGRGEEIARINRTLLRTTTNSCLVIGKSGIGTTTFMRGWAAQATNLPVFNRYRIAELGSESFHNLTASANGFSSKYIEAIASLPEPVIVVIDNFGSIIYNKPALAQSMTRLLRPLAEHPLNRLVLALEPQEYAWLAEQDPAFCRLFEAISLKTQPAADLEEILIKAGLQLQRDRQVTIAPDLPRQTIALCQRFASLGQLPSSAIEVLDEAIAESLGNGRNEVSLLDVQRVVADKTGVPFQQLAASETELLKKLLPTLQSAIIGQDPALTTITNFIQRAKLGLKNPHRPLGSFLVLGPSGVGKTETAKVLSTVLYGKKESFLRIDMSEFNEANTLPRLLGAPPGYVGYEAGGTLTNHVLSEPHSLILMDEIEKAHPKIFDIFLQILDDGRVTSGQGQTVDLTQTVLIATSNIAVDKIIQPGGGMDIQSPAFLREHIIPELQQHFRTEFINRFDAIVIFNPLSAEDLLDIAVLEIRKIEERVQDRELSFDIDTEMLEQKISEIIDPRLGARPIKRFVENTCETLIAQSLLENN
jgi:ATP-dependent Clp protease ATP-binding subunit ClpC